MVNVESSEEENESAKQQGEICPEIHANILSKYTFWWLNPLIQTGYKRPLETSDLYRIRPCDDSQLLTQELTKHWNSQNKPHPSLFTTIHSFLGIRFYFYCLLRLTQDACQLASPYIMKLIIDYISKPEEYEAWLGCIYILALLLLSVTGSLLLNNYIQLVACQGMRVRTALRAFIYNKSLRLSSNRDISSGDIVNFMSTDAQKVSDVVIYFHQLWSTIFQVVVCMGFLYYFIGVSMIAGVVIMLVSIPIQSIAAKITQKLRSSIMKLSGQRIQIINEILMGIRIIKFYAWENSFLQRVFEYRNSEMNKMKYSQFVNTLSSCVVHTTPLFVALFTFGAYALMGNQLTPSIIFPALGYLNQLRLPLALFPNLLSTLVEGRVSLHRLQQFLTAEEVEHVSTEANSDAAVQISGGYYKWRSANITDHMKDDTHSKKKKKSSSGVGDEPYSTLPEEVELEEEPEVEEESHSDICLSDINVSVKKGSMIAVIGQVGAGKSSLIHALLGEMHQTKGSSHVSGRIAYCPQQAWIQNCSVKDNILFGRPFDEKKYREVLRICALEHDLNILPAGELTEIGEKGINLSGGQKQRISLARAVYSDADIYFLDDVLSAVDAGVGGFIFENCINNYLSGKTRVFVTHQLQYISHCEQILVMKGGQIIQAGTCSDISIENSFPELLSVSKTDIEPEIEPIEVKEPKNSVKPSDTSGKLIDAEERVKGIVQLSVYKIYAKYSGGYSYLFAIALLYVLCQAFLMSNTYWLAYWSQQSTNTPTGRSLSFYLGIYMILGLAAAILQFFRELLFSFIGLRASTNLHTVALNHVVHAPTRFFDTTPTGRIISRFSKDIESTDTFLIQSLKGTFMCSIQVVGVLLMLLIMVPMFFFPLIPIIIFYYFLQDYFRRTSRELKRLDSLSRSPLYAYFSESLTGINTIRAYNRSEWFKGNNYQKLDENNRAHFCQLSSQRWLSMRLELIGSAITISIAVFCILGRSIRLISMDGSLSGLVLTTTLQITSFLNWTVRFFADSESAMNSVERLAYYCEDIEQEAAYETESKPEESWPSDGNITMNNISMRYRPDLDDILKGLSCNISSCEKIGIVGRTASGKSSLMSTLFRLSELSSGSIEIDGIDISTLGLFDLRSKISIIPQDPVLFSGTVRFNLDPFNTYSDRDIWQALNRVCMKDVVENLPLQLSAEVSEFGENFSVGQRQLFCMARAILKQTKILVMDEATANVDPETDEVIQHTVKNEFADRTVLIVAHRLNTVIDCDKVMLLDSGNLVEFDSPATLLSNESTQFHQLCKQTGPSNFILLEQKAQQKVASELFPNASN